MVSSRQFSAALRNLQYGTHVRLIWYHVSYIIPERMIRRIDLRHTFYEPPSHPPEPPPCCRRTLETCQYQYCAPLNPLDSKLKRHAELLDVLRTLSVLRINPCFRYIYQVMAIHHVLLPLHPNDPIPRGSPF